MLNIIPIRLVIKGPHVGKDQAVAARRGKLFENDITEPADDLSFVSAKYFNDRFNGHVVMEQAEIRDFC